MSLSGDKYYCPTVGGSPLDIPSGVKVLLLHKTGPMVMRKNSVCKNVGSLI